MVNWRRIERPNEPFWRTVEARLIVVEETQNKQCLCSVSI
jgi:hypothetical protein